MGSYSGNFTALLGTHFRLHNSVFKKYGTSKTQRSEQKSKQAASL